MKRYYFDTDLRGDPKPIEHEEGGLVYYADAQARIAELTDEVSRKTSEAFMLRNALVKIENATFFGHMDDEDLWKHMQLIARNALKEG